MLSGLPLYVTRNDSLLGPPTVPLANAALLALSWSGDSSSELLERRQAFPSWTSAGWYSVEPAGIRRANCTQMVVDSLHATPAVRVGVPPEKGELAWTWKELAELPWEQSGGQLVAEYIVLTGWTFKVTVTEKDKVEASRINQDGKFTLALPNNELAQDSFFSLHGVESGLVHGRELLAMPLYWELDSNPNLNQAKMVVILLSSSSKQIDSKEIHERVGSGWCFFRGDDLTALNAETDASRLPSWARGVFQTVYIG